MLNTAGLLKILLFFLYCYIFVLNWKKKKKTLHLKHYSGRDFTTKKKIYIISKTREAELANLDNLALKIYSKLLSRTSYILKFLLGPNDPLIQLE